MAVVCRGTLGATLSNGISEISHPKIVLPAALSYSRNMKHTILFIFIILLSTFYFTNATAEVYKKTNPDGSVTFSDVPSKIDAKPIKLPPSSRYSAPPRPEPTASPRPAKTAESYESVSITSPANDSAVRDNAGNLTIKFNVKPGLAPGHTYVLIMDGTNVGEGQTGNIQLKNVDRGSHTFIVQVVDKNKNMIIQSESVLVHLQRAVAR
jgi:hypothetical protein